MDDNDVPSLRAYSATVLAAVRAAELAGRLPAPSVEQLGDIFPFESPVTVVAFEEARLPEDEDELTPPLAADLGPMMQRIERAITTAIDGVGRVHPEPLGRRRGTPALVVSRTPGRAASVTRRGAAGVARRAPAAS